MLYYNSGKCTDISNYLPLDIQNYHMGVVVRLLEKFEVNVGNIQYDDAFKHELYYLLMSWLNAKYIVKSIKDELKNSLIYFEFSQNATMSRTPKSFHAASFQMIYYELLKSGFKVEKINVKDTPNLSLRSNLFLFRNIVSGIFKRLLLKFKLVESIIWSDLIYDDQVSLVLNKNTLILKANQFPRKRLIVDDLENTLLFEKIKNNLEKQIQLINLDYSNYLDIYLTIYVKEFLRGRYFGEYLINNYKNLKNVYGGHLAFLYESSSSIFLKNKGIKISSFIHQGVCAKNTQQFLLPNDFNGFFWSDASRKFLTPNHSSVQSKFTGPTGSIRNYGGDEIFQQLEQKRILLITSDVNLGLVYVNNISEYIENLENLLQQAFQANYQVFLKQHPSWDNYRFHEMLIRKYSNLKILNRNSWDKHEKYKFSVLIDEPSTAISKILDNGTPFFIISKKKFDIKNYGFDINNFVRLDFNTILSEIEDSTNLEKLFINEQKLFNNLFGQNVY